jgi:hypothetical protein
VLCALSILVQSAPTRVRGNLYPDEQKERWELRTFYAYPARRSACSRLVGSSKQRGEVENFPANSHAPAEDPTHSIFFSAAVAHFKQNKS